MAGSLAGNILIMPALYRALHSKGHTAAAGHLLCGISCILVYVVTPGGLAFWF